MSQCSTCLQATSIFYAPLPATIAIPCSKPCQRAVDKPSLRLYPTTVNLDVTMRNCGISLYSQHQSPGIAKVSNPFSPPSVVKCSGFIPAHLPSKSLTPDLFHLGVTPTKDACLHTWLGRSARNLAISWAAHAPSPGNALFLHPRYSIIIPSPTVDTFLDTLLIDTFLTLFSFGRMTKTA